ncbi:hypothetical protein Tco_0340714 [Tanacetum coccineum]
MRESKSYEKQLKHKALYDALVLSLIQDEDDLDRVIPDLRKRDCEEDEVPSAGSTQGKRKRSSRKDSKRSKTSSASMETSKGDTLPKTSKTGKSASVEESVKKATHEVTIGDEEPVQENVNDVDQPQDGEAAPKSDWFKQPPRPPTPDLEWDKCQVIYDQPEQPWFNNLLSAQKDPLTFDELMATPIDFSNFAMNRLKLDKITKENLVGPVYNLLKGDRCPFDLSKPLPLKGRPGHLTVAAEYFFNNDLEYLKYKDSERNYIASITNTKAARYELVGIEDMILNLWSVTKNILSVVSVKVNKLHGYGYLEEVVVRRANRQLYKFKEGDFVNLHLNDIEDMLLLVVQHKLFHLDGEVIVDLAVALPDAGEEDRKELGKIGLAVTTVGFVYKVNAVKEDYCWLFKLVLLDSVNAARAQYGKTVVSHELILLSAAGERITTVKDFYCQEDRELREIKLFEEQEFL